MLHFSILKSIVCEGGEKRNVKTNEDIIKEVSERNVDMVYRLAYSQTKNRHDADDVFQEVFYRYLKKRPVFESREHEKAWFIHVTLNLTKTQFKSFWKTKTAEFTENEDYGDSESGFDEKAVDRLYLQSALKKLPKKYRAVLHLFYYENLQTREIAEILQISDCNVRMLLSRARKMLKDILEREAEL